MIFNRKVQVIFSEQEENILDGQSKICNWSYNKLLEICITDYKENNNANNYLLGRNLRDQIPKLKTEFAFLKTVHSSPLKNTALRLKEAYDRAFKQGNGLPKYRSWKKRWFSLLYEEPNKGFKLLDNHRIQITLGVNEDNKRIKVVGTLKENLHMRESDKIKTFRLCKQQGRLYAVFSVERIGIKQKEAKKWIAIDPNHKNLFTSIDNQGNSIEFTKIPQLKYWDTVIDRLKSKRDKCLRKAKKRISEGDKTYYLPSKRYHRINKALDIAYHRRREQIKQSMYTIANYIAKHYDIVAIGDYTPSLDTAKYDTMHRSMLNQEKIGEFRRILEWVMIRSGKKYVKVDERNTTKTCCICGDKEKKDPSIRSFECSKCQSYLDRDINSAVNIAKKVSLLSGSDYTGWYLSNPVYTVEWNFRSSRIIFKRTSAVSACS